MDTFTNRFNEVLKLEQTNQANLANKIGIARQCITDYKSGKSFPTIQTLARICDTLEISSDYLLGLEDDFGAPTAQVETINYSSEERKLIEDYRELNLSGKRLINETIKTLLTTSAKSEQKMKV